MGPRASRGLELTRDNTPTPAYNRPSRPRPESICHMSLTLQDVSAIAHLARLELGVGEQAAMLSQLNDFFRIVEQMSTVDTTGIEPLYTPLSAVREVSLRLRDDAVSELDRRAANLQNAPAVDAGLFLVPKVLE